MRVAISTIQLNKCHPALQKQYKRFSQKRYTATIEEAIKSFYFKIAAPWFEAGVVCIPASETDKKLPALDEWTHLHTGGFENWSLSDLVFTARMFPNSNGLVLGGSPISVSDRFIIVDNDTGREDIDTWITTTFGPSLMVKSGRVGGGTHHYYKSDVALVPIYGQPSKNGRLGPDDVWEYKITEDSNGRKRGRWASKIDVKACGGYVVAPGSRHSTGLIYKLVGQRAGGITPEQIKKIPVIKASIDAHLRNRPSTANEEIDNSDKILGRTSSGYDRYVADFDSDEWRDVVVQASGLSLDTHLGVPCMAPGHNHKKANNKKATIYKTSAGFLIYNCHDHGETYIDKNIYDLANVESDVVTADEKVTAALDLAQIQTSPEEKEHGLYLRSMMLFDSYKPYSWFSCKNVRNSLLQRTADIDTNQTSYYRSRVCSAYACAVCGDRMINGYKAAYSVLIDEWCGQTNSLIGSRVYGKNFYDNQEPTSYSNSYSGLRFGAYVSVESGDLDSKETMRKRLENWATDAEDGKRRYLCVTISPGSLRWFAMWAGPEEDAPKGFDPMPIFEFKDTLLDIIGQIDIDGWKGYTGKTRPIEGQNITTKPARVLRDQVTGHAPPPWVMTKKDMIANMEREIMHGELMERFRDGFLPLEDASDLNAEYKKRVQIAAKALVEEKSSKLLIHDSNKSIEEINKALSEELKKDVKVPTLTLDLAEQNMSIFPEQVLITDATPEEIVKASTSIRSLVGDLRTRSEARQAKNKLVELQPDEINGLMFEEV